MLECKACGRVHDAPDDLNQARPPRPESTPRSWPASFDEINRTGWGQYLPIEEHGDFRPD
jgi:hypothetical protein